MHTRNICPTVTANIFTVILTLTLNLFRNGSIYRYYLMQIINVKLIF